MVSWSVGQSLPRGIRFPTKFNQMSRALAPVLLVNDLAERARVNALGFDAGAITAQPARNMKASPGP